MNDNYKALSEAAFKISGGDELHEELLHYSIDEFLRKPNLEAIMDSGGARFYCIRIMMNSWKSVSSPFFNTYRKASNELNEADHLQDIAEEDTTDLVAKIKYELNKLPWYDKMLFEIFVNENHNISSLSRATGIPRTSISLTINRIRKHIKRVI